MSTSIDTLINGDVILEQYLKGYRAGLDAVFLAAACPIQSNQTVLDVGCGVGAAFLCLHQRVKNIEVTGIEGNPDLCELAKKNSARNQCLSTIVPYKIPDRPDILGHKKFDHVITNPPYFEAYYHDPSPHLLKAQAMGEILTSLASWLDYCLRKLHDRGTLTLIYTADRIDDVLQAIHKRVGEIKIYPLWNHKKFCKRVIITGRKATKGGCILYPGMLIHNQDGTYTQNALAILSQGKKLSWD